jgi:H+/Cl- antiporter ClcA
MAAAFAAASRLPAAAAAAAVELTGRPDLVPAIVLAAVGAALVAESVSRVTLFTAMATPEMRNGPARDDAAPAVDSPSAAPDPPERGPDTPANGPPEE